METPTRTQIPNDIERIRRRSMSRSYRWQEVRQINLGYRSNAPLASSIANGPTDGDDSPPMEIAARNSSATDTARRCAMPALLLLLLINLINYIDRYMMAALE